MISIAGGQIKAKETTIFLCDMQERFRSVISHFESISKGCSRLLAASKLLQIPLIVTEQYPKGLLKTIPELDITHAKGVFEKTQFTMLTNVVESKLVSICKNNTKPKYVILCGVETHVCVQQTALDLLKRGIVVFVIADATSSRNQADRLISLRRMERAGAIITTVESVLFQLISDKDHPEFKAVQALIKDVLPDTGLQHL